MKLVVQRVESAQVEVDTEVVGKINSGLLVFLGVAEQDNGSEIDWLVNKLLGLRIFNDAEGKMNLSVQDIKGEVLLVSQFTLYADCSRGRRPGFSAAAHPEKAEKMYQEFADKLSSGGIKPQMGIFGADMKISLINDGPVTLVIER